MKKFNLWMTVTILTLCGLCSALTACSSNYNTPETDNNPLATQLNGCWWSQHDVGGTVTVDGGTTKTYAKKLQACRFGADGKAEWMKLLLDKDGGIVKAYGAIKSLSPRPLSRREGRAKSLPTGGGLEGAFYNVTG